MATEVDATENLPNSEVPEIAAKDEEVSGWDIN